MEKYGRVGQATGDSITWHMHFSCRIPKAAESYILLIHVNNGYANAPQYYVIRALRFFFTELI